MPNPRPFERTMTRKPKATVPSAAPKLAIELVPVSSWGLNLSNQLPKARWDELRRATYAKANHRCEICSGTGTRHPVECHEIWHFDPATQTQRLVCLISLCPDCHSVKHYGRLGALPPEYRAKAFAHLCRVNGWTKTRAEEHIRLSRTEWLVRCKIHWKVDTSLIGIQVDTGNSRGELLVTDLGEKPKEASRWSHVGNIESLGVSVWQRDPPPRNEYPGMITSRI